VGWESKSGVLGRIYRLHDEFTGTLNLSCKRRCADCCTRNVTVTSLEGYMLFQHLRRLNRPDLLERIREARQSPRFQPQITTNRLATLCIDGVEPPDENCDPRWTPCPLLQDDECPVYDARPLGCRCLVSTRTCAETGCAEMDPFVLSVNNLFLQAIEHFDTPGFSGNLTDMLLWLDSGNRSEPTRTDANIPNGLIANQPISALLIPQEHRARIQPILSALNRIHQPDPATRST